MPYYIEVEAIQVQENLTLVPGDKLIVYKGRRAGLMQDKAKVHVEDLFTQMGKFQQWAETNGLELDFSPRHGEE